MSAYVLGRRLESIQRIRVELADFVSKGEGAVGDCDELRAAVCHSRKITVGRRDLESRNALTDERLKKGRGHFLGLRTGRRWCDVANRLFSTLFPSCSGWLAALARSGG